MKRTTLTALIALFVSFVLLTGCEGEGDTIIVQEIVQEGCTGPTPATLAFWTEVRKATENNARCERRLQDDLADCMERYPDSQFACWDLADHGEQSCRYHFGRLVNKILLRSYGPGAEVFILTGRPGGYGFAEQEDGTVVFEAEDDGFDVSVNLEDFDGDGIINWYEFVMGLNPGDPNTYGTCYPGDAELDYDVDEIPNGEDELPLCPDFEREEPDPAGYYDDCV